MLDIPAMLKSALGSILDRDLNTLRREVEAYSDEADLWRTAPGISNSAGTLVLHLAGNLQHYFGAQLGRTTYVRDRPAEFARRGVPRAELLQEIEAARAAVKVGLSQVTNAQLAGNFPEAVGGTWFSTGEYLLHLATHFAYHLGQVDFHRRMVTGSPATVGAMRPAELSSAHAAGVQA